MSASKSMNKFSGPVRTLPNIKSAKLTAAYANIPTRSKIRTPNNNSKRENLLFVPPNERPASRNQGVEPGISTAYAVSKSSSHAG